MRSNRTPRTDVRGRAYAGSQLQVQIYVNRQAEGLSVHVSGVMPGLASDATLRWVSPLEAEKFAEYQDAAFLTKVGLAEHAEELRAFWPRGGPVWDALAVVEGSQRGVVLVEAKSHPQEVYGNGCQAKGASRRQIAAALDRTKAWLGVSPGVDWMGPLYQSANRLAHLYFLREVIGVPAWLVNLYFVGDPHSPTTREEWEATLDQVKSELGLEGIDVPFTGEVLFEARNRSMLFGGGEQ